MKIRLHQVSIALAFLLLTCPSAREGIFGQAIDPNGIPDEIKACLLSKPGSQLDGNINPYYINGDCDGDGITDFAVLIRNESDRGGGIHHILFCFGSGKTVLWDADTRPGSSSSPFTTWFLERKQSKLLSIHPKINHDSLAILIGEEGGGIVYWDGRKLNWQMEE